MINLFPKLHLKQKLILGADSYIGIGVKKKLWEHESLMYSVFGS